MKDTEVSKIIIYIGIVVMVVPAVLLAAYYGVLYLVWEGEPHFIQANRCMNAGGVFQSDIERCWYAGQCEDEGGYWYPAESRCVFDR